MVTRGQHKDGELVQHIGAEGFSSYQVRVLSMTDSIRIEIIGRLSEAIPEADVREVVSHIAESSQWRIIFDLGQCEHISSVALSFVVRAVQAASGRGACAVAVNGNEHVHGLLDILGLGGVLRICASEADAEELFAERGY